MSETELLRATLSCEFGRIGVNTPAVADGHRVGIMGGTFNPPHDGHRIVAETALKRLALDQLWWLVTPGNPLKANSNLPSEETRMADIARMAAHPRMKITAFERELGTPYTAATLAFLRNRYPNVHFVWVMGADNLAGFHRWQQWRRIAQMMPFAVVDRPGWRMKALNGPAAHALNRWRIQESEAAALPLMPPPAWTFITSRLSPLSSTDLRNNRL